MNHKMHFEPTHIFEGNENGGFKASRRNTISKYGWNSSTNHESPSELARRKFVSSTGYDWETVDDHMTRDKYYEPLINALSSNDTLDSFVLADVSKEFSSGCILHEAISLGVPERVLMLLADRFPIFLTQIDGNGRYPIHVACIFGVSLEFVSRYIDMNPSSAAAKDIEGKSPIHILCQGTWQGSWDINSNPAAEKNMIDILSKLYNKAPSSVVCEDNYGVGSVEYAIDSNLGMEFILELQEKIGHFNENEVCKKAHRKCAGARRQLQRKNSPHAAFEA